MLAHLYDWRMSMIPKKMSRLSSLCLAGIPPSLKNIPHVSCSINCTDGRVYATTRNCIFTPETCICVCVCLFLWLLYSRVIISHWFGVLHVPLNGLEGSGVQDFLSSLAITPASSVQWLPVQHMNPQQETVVHDFKALQDLRGDRLKH